jgi:predicted GIY-YIG superfamily endonuclease
MTRDNQDDVYVVYMLTTDTDSKMYIGSTTQRKFGYRMGQHRRGRFSDNSFESKIIFECDSYEQCLDMEEALIAYYDTYRNGLNRTVNGRGNHNAPNFTTKGYKFPEEVKKRISETSKKRIPRVGWKHTEEIKKHWSNIRCGEKHSVLSESQAREIIELYLSKPELDGVGKGHPKGYGRVSTYESVFSKTYVEKFQVPKHVISRLIRKKSWSNLWKEYS